MEAAVKPDYGNEIIDIIRGNLSPKKTYNSLKDYHENDIADVFPNLTKAERQKLYRIVDVEMLSDILEYADESDVAKYLDEMDVKKAAFALSHMESDSAFDVLKSMQKDKRQILIDLMDESVKRDVALISSFDDDEIGSRMSTNFITIRDNLTVKEAMQSMIEQAEKNDNIFTLFVEDEGGEFYGALDLKDLIVARKNTELESLVVTSYPYVYGHENIDDCIEKLKDYSENMVPVLSNDNVVIGVITSQDLVEVVDEEMGEDYAMFAGLTAEEDLNEPLRQSLKKRLPWLIILLVLGMVVSSVVGIFEAVVAVLPLIICFQSLILDMSGNVGTQSLAVTIRVLTDEKLSTVDKLRLIIKEVRVGAVNGLILGSLAFVAAGLYIYIVKPPGFDTAFLISSCIGLSLFVSMIISSAVGTLIPLFFTSIGVDPAVASGPLITTMNDLIAVVSYYGLSWLLLLNILHLA